MGRGRHVIGSAVALKILGVAACSASVIACAAESPSFDAHALPSVGGEATSGALPDGGASPATSCSEAGTGDDGGLSTATGPVVGSVTGFANVSTALHYDLACTTTDCYGARGRSSRSWRTGRRRRASRPFSLSRWPSTSAAWRPRARSSTRRSRTPAPCRRKTSPISSCCRVARGRRSARRRASHPTARSRPTERASTRDWAMTTAAALSRLQRARSRPMRGLRSRSPSSPTRSFGPPSTWRSIRKGRSSRCPARRKSSTDASRARPHGRTWTRPHRSIRTPQAGRSPSPRAVISGSRGPASSRESGPEAPAQLGVGGIPFTLMKIPSGATTAIATGIVVSPQRSCGPSAIDGKGRLLFNCATGLKANAPGPIGTFRSQP